MSVNLSESAGPVDQAGPARAVLADGEIVRRVLAGERELFEELVHRHEEAVYRRALKYFTRREDAEDVAQETFLNAYRGLGTFRGEQPFRPWILGIATNAAMSRLRRGRVMYLSLDAEMDPQAASVESVVVETINGEELAGRLAAAVASLPEEQAAIFRLRYEEEMGVGELAALFGAKAGTMAVVLHRLREKLRGMVFDGDRKGRGR